MDVQEMREGLNGLLKEKRYAEVYELIEENRDVVASDNDLAVVRCMLSVCEHESEDGQRPLFEKISSLEEIVTRYTKLMFYLRRFEFGIMDDNIDGFNQYLIQNQVSLQELFVVMYCGVINKEKVLQIIKEKMIDGEIAL